MALRAFLMSFGASSVSLAIGLCTGVIAARVLGVEDRGHLGVIVFWTQFVAAFFFASMSDAVVVRAGAEENPEAFKAAVFWVGSAVTLVALPVGGSVLWFFLREESELILFLTLVLWVPMLIVSSLDQVVIGLLRVQKRFAAVNALRIGMPASYLLFMVIAALCSPGLIGFVIAHVCALCVALIVRIWVSRPWTAYRLRPTGRKLLLSTMFRFHQSTVVAIVTTQIDRLVVVQWGAAKEIGLYLVALTVAGAFQGFLHVAIKTIVLPHLVFKEVEHRLGSTLRLLRVTWIISLTTAVVTAAIAPLLIPLLFGSEYALAGWLASWLTLAMSLMPVRSILSEAFRAQDEAAPPLRAELFFLGAFIVTWGAASALGLLWPVAWGLAAANVASALYLAFAFKALHPTAAVISWIFPGRKGIGEVVFVGRQVSGGLMAKFARHL